MYRTKDEIPAMPDWLSRLGAGFSNIGKLAVNEPSAARLVESLGPGTLLVVGAPGGSWLQRHVFGTGHRLVVRAPGGALVVRCTTPRRCFQDATCPAGGAIGGGLSVRDALQVLAQPLVPVAEDGRLVGLARLAALVDVDPTLPVMETPIAVAALEPRAAVAALRPHFGDSPIPVVDSDGYLLGTILQAPVLGADSTRRLSPSLSISYIPKPLPRRVGDSTCLAPLPQCDHTTADLGRWSREGRLALKTRTETIATGELTRLNRVALKLEYATVGWNVGEAVLTIGLGAAASSLALIGFGTVSIVEVFASGVVVWHLLPGHAVSGPARTARAHRLVAVAFAALTAALTIASLRDLLTGRRPEESPWGIAYLAITALVMFGLAVWKRRIATRLDSSPLRSEASMTFLDGVLSTSTMLGLLLNAVVGWWWADPAAALIVGIAAAREAVENWREASNLHRPG